MSERGGFQAGVPCWIDTWQADADAAVAFYAGLFGWEAEDTMPAGVPGKHFMCRLRGRDVAAVASRPGSSPPVTTWITYVWVESAEDAVAAAVDAGCAVLVEPFESLDGGRIGVIRDPAGAALGVWKPGTHSGATLVNEPGAWAMSALATPDSDGAAAFYDRLFGWQTDTFGEGAGAVTLWRLPGYVGGEPEQPVPRDVVAVMLPAQDGAQWGVDFWVDDVHAAAARAADLGGRAVMPPSPTDVGVTAVLSDPEGAVFSVSRVGPPR